MPVTVKSVAKGYTYNTNYDLDARRFRSIIGVLENSRDYLNKPQVAHIVLQVEEATFNKTAINEALTKTLSKLDTGFGYFLALEKSEYSGFHIHIMLTFSTGTSYAFTLLSSAIASLYALDGVKTAIALPRKTDRSIPIDTRDYYKEFKKLKDTNNYFHNLLDTAEFNDSIHRYSYLSKKETKEIKGITRFVQSKSPSPNKTKQEQKKRKYKVTTNG